MKTKMRTKTTILSAVALAAGLLSSQAQSNVYSVNVVGYVNVAIPANSFLCVANPLDSGTNTLENLFASAPITTTKVWYWNGSTWISTTKRATGFLPAYAHNFNPGEGFFVQNTSASPITNTFVGNVKLGTNLVSYPTGFTPIGAVPPVAGTVETALGFPAYFVSTSVADKVLTFDPVLNSWLTATRRASSWSGNYYVPPGGAAASGQPIINVAQGFFIQAANPSGGTWTNVFNMQ